GHAGNADALVTGDGKACPEGIEPVPALASRGFDLPDLQAVARNGDLLAAAAGPVVEPEGEKHSGHRQAQKEKDRPSAAGEKIEPACTPADQHGGHDDCKAGP